MTKSKTSTFVGRGNTNKVFGAGSYPKYKAATQGSGCLMALVMVPFLALRALLHSGAEHHDTRRK